MMSETYSWANSRFGSRLPNMSLQYRVKSNYWANLHYKVQSKKHKQRFFFFFLNNYNNQIVGIKDGHGPRFGSDIPKPDLDTQTYNLIITHTQFSFGFLTCVYPNHFFFFFGFYFWHSTLKIKGQIAQTTYNFIILCYSLIKKSFQPHLFSNIYIFLISKL